MKRIRPKKYLGQHFLTDLTIAERIADTISPYTHLPILEVGPGMGVLTDFLLPIAKDLTLIELDAESIPYLREKYPKLQTHIIEGDFLKMNLREHFPNLFCVIGNYPYNISSQIFFRVVEHKDRIPFCSGMIQKEVALRLAAQPCSKDFGVLSIMVQAWYDVEYLFEVSNRVFNPPPKVTSAVIQMKRNSRENLGCNEKLFRTIVKTSFTQRRKTLRNGLKSLVGGNMSILSGALFDKRPEQLSVEDFIHLTTYLEESLQKGIKE